MHTTQNIYDNLGSTLLELNKQIDAVKKSVANQIPIHVEPAPDAVYHWRNTDGKPVLGDLLCAKANVLSAMATLKATTVKR